MHVPEAYVPGMEKGCLTPMRKCALLFAALLLLLLAACDSRADFSAAGRYICTATGDENDIPMSHADVWLQLEEDGRGVLCLNEERELTWQLNGTALSLQLEEAALTASLADGVITLDYDGCRYFLTLAELLPEELPTAELLPDLAQQALKNDTALQQQWNGNWYGWWEMHGATGGYTDREGQRRDLCARIEIDGSGEGSISLWDETGSASAPTGQVRIAVQAADGGKSVASSEDGFFAGDTLRSGDWVIEPDLYQYTDLLVIEGACTDEAGTYNYSIFLRPWGTIWSDIEVLESEQLPYRYFDWYLPALEESAAMPDTVGGEWVAGSQGVSNDPTGKTATAIVADGRAVLVYSTSQYKTGTEYDLVSLDGTVRFTVSWCSGTQEITGSLEKMNDGRTQTNATEQDLYVNGYTAHRVSYYDSATGLNRIEYLIEAGSVYPDQGAYLSVTMTKEEDGDGVDAVAGTFQLR